MIPLLLGVGDALLEFRWTEVGGCNDEGWIHELPGERNIMILLDLSLSVHQGPCIVHRIVTI
jgi:hypothetical protein